MEAPGSGLVSTAGLGAQRAYSPERAPEPARDAASGGVASGRGLPLLRALCKYLRMHADTDTVTTGLAHGEPRSAVGAHRDDRRDEIEDHLVELAVEVFAMFADATRLRIVLALRDGELPVARIAEAVRKSPSAVSQHLAKLRMARMVSTRQDGTRVFYRLTDEHVRELVTDAIYQAEHVAEGLPRLHHHEADEATPARRSVPGRSGGGGADAGGAR
jgi:DNA-binding transcriptional ArsR family regulator